MSNSVFPSLAGQAMKLTKTPLWKTMKEETVSGREYRGTFMLYPRYRYELSFDLLRDTAAKPDLKTLMGFFNEMKGAYDTFLLTDPDDYTVTDMQFATGTGAATQFQLTRSRGTNSLDPIYDLNGTPTIKNDGVTVDPGDYSISASGLVTFDSAPGNGDVLTWTGSYYWRCRFLDDEMDFDKFMHQMWEVQRVPLITVKP